MRTRKPIPFSISRDDARTLLAQVTDGFRSAIVSGYYAPGDILPTSRELARLLGVSMIVSAPALKRLADEGLVDARPRRGTVVRDRGARQWRGHVLFVCPEGDENYEETVVAGALRNGLSEAGYLFTQVCIPLGSCGRYDFGRLDVALAQSVDLAVTMSVPPPAAHFARRKIPFVAYGALLKEVPHSAVGVTRLDLGLAMPDFAAACAARGVDEVVGFYWNDTMGDVTALREAGIRVRKIKVRADESNGVLIGARRAGMEAFRKIVEKLKVDPTARRSNDPTARRVYFFNDDYVASGALMALADSGLKAPRDVRVVTFASKRLGPVYVRELSRMEFDQRHAGEVLTGAVLEYLKTGVYPTNSVVGPVWIEGETLG
ncbi:MAG: GntR family transcriptional regulator [Kiritimatiellae bacterium]|nr:GntR family transcriptional regulator [Kiritimatiellia bacterium]